MATMYEIVVRACRKIGVVAEDEPPTAQQMQGGLDALNSMMSGWRSAGVNYDHPSELTGPSDYPLGPRWVRHAVHLLAQEIAPDYGLGFEAGQFLRELQVGLCDIPLIATGRELRNTPSQSRYQRVTSNG